MADWKSDDFNHSLFLIPYNKQNVEFKKNAKPI